MGVGNLIKFPFLDRPMDFAIVRALELLYALNALDIEGNLTKDIGNNISEFPIDAKLAVILLNSSNFSFIINF